MNSRKPFGLPARQGEIRYERANRGSIEHGEKPERTKLGVKHLPKRNALSGQLVGNFLKVKKVWRFEHDDMSIWEQRFKN